jgi:hypothetical protein
MSRLKDSALLLGSSLIFASCGDSDRVAGNSANTGNAQAVGLVVTATGAPAQGVWIECRPDSLPPWEGQEPGWSTVTDSSGRYTCTDLPAGRVGIAARDFGTGLTAWRADTVHVGTAPTPASPDTLAPAGALRVALPPNTTGVLYMTGLGRSYSVRGETELELAGIPARWQGALVLARSLRETAVVDSGLRVRPGQTDSAGYTRRSATLRIPLGGKLTASVLQLPLLVRLDSAWTGFVHSLADGSDLRLTTTSGKPLPTTVARWDRSGRSGAVWTTLDTVAAPGDSVDLVLSWGLPVPASAASAAFTASRGWAAAWPLGDTGSTATERLGAFPGQAVATSSVAGPIARASRFDGRTSLVRIPGSSTGVLAPPDAGPYTWSCWVRLQDFGTSRFVMGHGENGSHLKFQRNFGADTNSWMAKAFRTTPPGGFYRFEPADTARWTHLAMTFADSTVDLYVDGVRSDFAPGFHPVASGRKALPFLIGAAIDTLDATSQHFYGDIAEAWAQNIARSPDWIRLVAANQKPGAPAARPVP